MRYGIFSDIHSNVYALSRVIAAFSIEDIDRYICLGDFVGYGAKPHKCIRMVSALDAACICGNHDWASVGLTDSFHFNKVAEEAVLWTSSVLNEEEKRFLKSLALVYEDNEITAVHGTLDSPAEFLYMQKVEAAKTTIKVLRTPVCFIGHSHVPVVFAEGDKQLRVFKEPLEVTPARKQIINVGSVGQPRDGDPRAAYVVYDTETRMVELKRIEYDVKRTQEEIIKAGLPRSLAVRLATGT